MRSPISRATPTEDPTTPAWKPVVEALGNLVPGGRLVTNAIRKEEADKESLLQLDSPIPLWSEKEIKSVANVSHHDVNEFRAPAAEMKLKPGFPGRMGRKNSIPLSRTLCLLMDGATTPIWRYDHS